MQNNACRANLQQHIVKKIFICLITMVLTTVCLGAPTTKGRLVRIKDINSRILIDLKYATSDNFLKQKVYDTRECYLLDIAVRKLNQVQCILEEDGLGLKIYDGYRPLSVQQKMWAILPDPRFVANPYKGGSLHCRGVAVDLTLVDSEGNELEMPTAFDNFTERAFQFSKEPTPVQRANRMLLRRVMQDVGFEYIRTEWWHYQLPNGRQYPVIREI